MKDNSLVYEKSTETKSLVPIEKEIKKSGTSFNTSIYETDGPLLKLKIGKWIDER